MILYRIQNISGEYQSLGINSDPRQNLSFDPDEIQNVEAEIWQNLTITQQGNFLVLDILDDSTDPGMPPPAGATEATLQDVLAAVEAIEITSDAINIDADQIELSVDGLEALATATNSKLDDANVTLTSLDGKDYATSVKQDAAQTTLDSLDSKDYATETTLSDLDVKVSTAVKQDTAQTTLDAINTGIAGVILDLDALNALVSTAANQVTTNSKLDTLHADLLALQSDVDGLEGFTDDIETKLDTINSNLTGGSMVVDVTDRAARLLGHVEVDASALPTGAATEASLAAAKLDLDAIAADTAVLTAVDFATAANQSSELTKLDTLHADLLAVQGYVDGLEGFTDGLETLITSTNTKLDSLITSVETLLPGGADNATTSEVPAANADTELLAANPNRKGAAFYNNSTATAYIKLGTGASTTSYLRPLGPGGFFELMIPTYKDVVHAFWTAADGEMHVTELY